MNIINIVLGTPWWVWLVFGYLLWVGINATKERTIWLPKLFIVPTVLIALKSKIFLTADPLSISSYILWLFIGGSIGYTGAFKTGAEVLRDSNSIRLPGSYQTLTLLMSFFVVKYFFGFLNAKHPDIAIKYFLLEVIISAAFSGYFLGRALAYLLRLFR